MSKLEMMLEWGASQKDVKRVVVGYDKNGFFTRTEHTDKRVVEGYGPSIDDSIMSYNETRQRVLTVEKTFKNE